MLYKTHMVGSVVFSTATLILLNKYNLSQDLILSSLIIFPTSFFGASVPDIDSPNSIIRRRIRKMFGRNPNPKKNIRNHRRIPHLLSFWILFFSIAYIYPSNFTDLGEFTLKIINNLILGFSIGVLSHLFLDLFNPSGLALLGPFSKKRYRIARIKSGSKKEQYFKCLLIIIEIALVLYFVKMLFSF